MQVDAWERGFSYSYDAPLDMRMDPEPGADAPPTWSTSGRRRGSPQVLRELRRGALRARIAREIVRRRPLETTGELVEAIKAADAGRGPLRRAAIPPSGASRRSGSPSTASSSRSTARCRWPGELLPPGGRFAAISFHSLEDRRVKRFLAELARGCVCPPELPVCVCGHEPEAELLTRRAVAPARGESERNPRSRSAHLRAAAQAARRGVGAPRAKTAAGARDALRPRQRRRSGAPRRAAARPHRRAPAATARPQRPAAPRPRRSPARPGRGAAGAVGDLPDSGLVVRLTRGRRGSAVLGALLVGIVALNVVALSFSASSSNAGTARRRAAAPELGAAHPDRRAALERAGPGGLQARADRPARRGRSATSSPPATPPRPPSACATALWSRAPAARPSGPGDGLRRPGRPGLGRRSGRRADDRRGGGPVTDPAASAGAPRSRVRADGRTDAGRRPAATGGGLAAP